MNIFHHNDYKKILRERLKELKAEKHGFSLKKIAKRIAIQYTYLSKAMRHPEVHLSEDHLHETCAMLNFFADETEYILALRGHAVATSAARKDFLQKKILSLRNSRELSANQEKNISLSGDVNFLLSPLAWLTYFALGIREYRENPRRIANVLGLEPEQLKSILHSLYDNALIEIDENIYRIRRVNKNHFHYSSNHPLTRIHQQMLRSASDSHFLRLPEMKKQRLMATFNADPATLERIQELFANFIKDVEKSVVASPSRRCYQLNFELFQWF